MTTSRESATLERAATPRSDRVLSPLSRGALRFLLVAAAAAVVAYVLVHIRLVVVPLFVGLLISTLLVPVADRLRRLRVPSAFAATLTVAGFVGVIGLVLFLIAPPVADQLTELGEVVRDGLDQVAGWVASGPFGLSQADLDRLVNRATTQLSTGASTVAGGVLSVSIVAFEVLVGFLLALVVTWFFLHDGRGIWRFFLRFVPVERRPRVERFGEESWTSLSGYVHGVVTIALFDAVFIALALMLIGVPLVLPLAVLTFLAAFIPIVGAVTAGAVAALVALVSGGVTDALLVVAAITLVQQIEGNLLYPIVVGRTISLHALVILLSVTAGAVLLGIVGAALAVPIAAITWSAIKAWREDLTA